MGKSKWSVAQSQYILTALNLGYNKSKLQKTLDYWSRDLLNFEFLKKGLWIVSPPHFAYYFSRKIFLLLYSINWPNFIEILSNICIAIVFFSRCDLINFEINLNVLIRSFFYVTKNSRQNYKYLENRKSF